MKKARELLALEQHFETLKNTRLSELFNSDPDRAGKLSIETGHLFLDFSKNHINQNSLSLLLGYLQSKDLERKRRGLFTGKRLNTTENRAALHTALRDKDNHFSAPDSVHESIIASQKKMFSLAEDIRSGRRRNHEGKIFRHMICVGIGGSYLGPKFVHDALKGFHDHDIDIRFLANIDPDAFDKTLEGIDPQKCLFFLASKSFSTLEVSQNANKIKSLLLNSGVSQHELKHFFIAASSKIKAAQEFGLDKDSILPLWDYVGGRFSLWSTIGFPLALALGEKNFMRLLQGAHEMDRHFAEKDLSDNLPVVLALLAFWYQSFFKSETRAIVPYSHLIKTFPAFLQQLEMESLGKRITTDNEFLELPGGAIIWGSEGPNSQHAFHQLIKQGSHLIPTDFLIFKNNTSDPETQQTLQAQCFAQSAAFAFGNQDSEPYKQVPGNQPSNTLLIDELGPESIGQLIALYEHKTFVQGVLLDINPFDQWGVELGKKVTEQLLPCFNNSERRCDIDSSTLQLIHKSSCK